MNVVITGTSSGLGRELAQRFKEDGHHVIGSCVSNDEEHSEQPVLDLGLESSVVQFAHHVKKRMDRVDLLINNAGVNSICRFEMLEVSFINRIMDVNFLGPVMLTKSLLHVLSNGGTVVNVISDAAWRPMRHSLAYNCSKAALDMATKQMARELTKPYNMSVVGIRPGKMAGTGMSQYIDQMVCELRGWTPTQAQQYYEANSVTGQEMPPKHVAGLIYNLVVSGSLRFMSGACLDLAG